MTNHDPVAGDFIFHTGFNSSGFADDYFDDNDILINTPYHDVDGDLVHLAFVNGQRVATTEPEGPAPDPTNPNYTHIQGEYGTLTVASDGTFTYQWDQDNAAVQAVEADGGKLADHFTFKVSDGRGGTDFGYFTVDTEAPQHGNSTITFEDANSTDFPDVYKGLAWGDTQNGEPLKLNTDGNHFVYTTPDDPSGGFTFIGSASYYQYLTYDAVDIKTSSSTQGADITFDGYGADGNLHELKVAVGPGTGGFDMAGAEHVSLDSLGPVNQLYISYDFTNDTANPHDIPSLMFDNLSIAV